MMGSGNSPGLYTMAADNIFAIKKPNQRIHVCFYEIYCSQLYDLLHERAKLVLREDGNANVNVVGIRLIEVSNADELLQCIDKGNEQRITSATSANYDSSRSHSILQIKIVEEKGDVGKICFIDLAGNERGADTYDNDKQTRLDGAEINKSLLALKECIRALDQGGKHTPFRGSKLTQVLKDSFIGNCRTMMIANISPSQSCCELTLNTLRYADRVKELSSIKGSGRKDDNLSNKLLLPRIDKAKKVTSMESSDKNKLEGFPQMKKPPKPVENKPLHSFQDIEKNPSYSDPKLPFENNQKGRVPGVKNPLPPRQRSDSAHKNKKDWNWPSSGREISKNNKRGEDRDEFSQGDRAEIKNAAQKKLRPIPVKNPPQSSSKQVSMLPKKAPAQKFTILNKFFKKPLDSLTRRELKSLHMEIIDDMIVYEENFLEEHKKCSDVLEDCMMKQKNVLDSFQEPSHEISSYIDEAEKLLDVEFETTKALKAKLVTFKKYLHEENAFAKKYIVEQKKIEKPPHRPGDDNAYEIRSHDSLLLDD